MNWRQIILLSLIGPLLGVLAIALNSTGGATRETINVSLLLLGPLIAGCIIGRSGGKIFLRAAITGALMACWMNLPTALMIVSDVRPWYGAFLTMGYTAYYSALVTGLVALIASTLGQAARSSINRALTFRWGWILVLAPLGCLGALPELYGWHISYGLYCLIWGLPLLLAGIVLGRAGGETFFGGFIEGCFMSAAYWAVIFLNWELVLKNDPAFARQMLIAPGSRLAIGDIFAALLDMPQLQYSITCAIIAWLAGRFWHGQWKLSRRKDSGNGSKMGEATPDLENSTKTLFEGSNAHELRRPTLLSP